MSGFAGEVSHEVALPVEPMLAAPTDHFPAGKALRGSWFEPKWDGYRAMVSTTKITGAAGRGVGAQVWSRRGHDITGAFPDLAEVAARLLPPGCVLDGELLIWGDGHLDFGALQRRLAAGKNAASLARSQPANFMAFDLLVGPDTDLRDQPLATRRTALEEILGDAGPPLQMTPYTTDADQARAWLAQYAQTRVGIEGLVIKSATGVYEPGRRGWLKLRFRDTYEVVVGAITGTLVAPDRLVVGYLDPVGDLVIAGSTAPLSRRQADELRPLLAPPDGQHPWPDEIGSGRLGHWGGPPKRVTLVEPTAVVEIAADSAVDQGKWRHLTRFVRARPDLTPDEVASPG
jgi:ATP-dependent DNA ligase